MALARIVAPSGLAVGIDFDDVIVDLARKEAAEQGVGKRLLSPLDRMVLRNHATARGRSRHRTAPSSAVSFRWLRDIGLRIVQLAWIEGQAKWLHWMGMG